LFKHVRNIIMYFHNYVCLNKTFLNIKKNKIKKFVKKKNYIYLGKPLFLNGRHFEIDSILKLWHHIKTVKIFNKNADFDGVFRVLSSIDGLIYSVKLFFLCFTVARNNCTHKKYNLLLSAICKNTKQQTNIVCKHVYFWLHIQNALNH